MKTIDYAFLLFGFHWIPFGESSFSRSEDRKLSRAIIGGDLADSRQFPYAVSLQQYDKGFNLYDPICTATLITTMAVLSAAHCVIRSGNEIGDIDDYIGVLGTVDVMDRTNNVTFQEICIHSKYNKKYGFNDIAMLTLFEPVKLGDTIKTIPLIGTGLSVVGMRGIAIGWGKTDIHDIEGSGMLRYADVNIVAFDVCDYHYEYASNAAEICFGTEGTGICEGDSGGPVVVKVRNVEVQVGIATNSDPLCSDAPSIGANISSFNRWIRNNVVGTPVFIS